MSDQTAFIILFLFSAVWIFLGWFWGRKNRDLDDYVLAGRKVGLSLGIATAMATWVTSNTTLVAPQLAYQMGIWGMIGYSFGSVGLILFAPMAERIRKLMPNGYTSGDFIRLRYGKTAWRVFLLISIIYGAGWLVSLSMAGGILVEALSGISYQTGMTVILFVCVAYTLLGGLKAVIGTDFIQTIIILAGIGSLGFLLLDHITFQGIHSSLTETRPQLLNLLMPAAIMFLFNNVLFGMGEIFHSNVWWSRAFAFADGVGFKAYLYAGLFWIPVPIAAGFIALAAPALGINVPRADMVAPLVASALLGKTGSILVFIVIFSALASSLDSLLAATSDLIVEDIYRRHFRPNAELKDLKRAAFYSILILGMATWLVSLPRISDLASILHFTGALVASTIWPIAAGLYWKDVSVQSATPAMIIGSLAGLVAYFMIGFYVAALTGAAFSMVTVLVMTKISPSRFDWKLLNEEHP